MLLKYPRKSNLESKIRNSIKPLVNQFFQMIDINDAVGADPSLLDDILVQPGDLAIAGQELLDLDLVLSVLG